MFDLGIVSIEPSLAYDRRWRWRYTRVDFADGTTVWFDAWGARWRVPEILAESLREENND